MSNVGPTMKRELVFLVDRLLNEVSTCSNCRDIGESACDTAVHIFFKFLLKQPIVSVCLSSNLLSFEYILVRIAISFSAKPVLDFEGRIKFWASERSKRLGV